jgi:hypothetical protein
MAHALDGCRLKLARSSELHAGLLAEVEAFFHRRPTP